MNKLIDWLESRLGRFAVPHLTLALIIGQALVLFAVYSQQPDVLSRVAFDRDAILRGEWWRVFTYLFAPPDFSILWTLIFWWVFHLIGSTLESHWGDFRFNLYLFVGWAATTLCGLLLPDAGPVSNVFLMTSIFLAFGRLFPDVQFLLFFIIPVKVKWLAMLQAAGLAIGLLTGDWSTRAMILSSVLAYFVFFGEGHLADLRAGARRKSYQAKIKPVGKMQHVCAVCGRSSADEPGVAFRYCSQCAGGACYCPDHLHNHEHIEAA